MADGDDNDDDLRSYASPPCYMHEVDPAYMGLPRPGEEKAAKGTPKPRSSKKPPARKG